MVREKGAKTKIKRRSAGLVITPPVPRPVASDHPARLLFKDAIESAKASSETSLAENQSAAAAIAAESQEVSTTAAAPKTNPTGDAPRAEPLQIFKELKSQPEALRQEEQ